MKPSLAVLILLSTLMTSAQACPVCFGAKGDPVVDAAGFAILFLLAVVVSILGGVIAFVLTLAKRSQRYQQQLQEGEAEWIDLTKTSSRN